MVIIRQKIGEQERQPRETAFSRRSLPFKPLWIVIVCALGLLVAAYAFPLNVVEDIGAQTTRVAGLYAPERNADFSYAYTRSVASLRIPGTGSGLFITRLRMAGLNGHIPVVAGVRMAGQHVALGIASQPRVYQLLFPAMVGDLQLHVTSTTRRVEGDPRLLGLLLDWIQVGSLGPSAPPIALLLGIPFVLAALMLSIHPLNISPKRQYVLLLLYGATLGVVAGLSRGKAPLALYWLSGGGIVAAAAVHLVRFVPSAVRTGTRAAATVAARLRQREWTRLAVALRLVVPFFILWRVGLWLVGALGAWYSNLVYPFAKLLTTDGAIINRTELVNEFSWRIFFANWMQWDSHHYQSIALNGYVFFNQHWPNIAFFPLYPLLIRFFYPLVGKHTEVAALLVSNLAWLAALLLMYDLLTRDFDRAIAIRTIVFLLVFPTSFYFGAGYSESVALVFTVAAVWAMRRRYWWLAGAAGGLLALTRVPGVFIAPVLALTYFQHHQWRWRAIRADLLAVFLPPLGLASFMFYQWLRFDTPFAFMIAQRDWDNQLSLPWVMPNMLIARLQTSFDWPITLFQIVVWVAFVGLTLVAVFRLPLAYSLTAVLLIVPPYLSSWFRSLPRHVLIVFPCFVALALLMDQTWLRRALIGAMVILLIIATVLYVNGFWVA